MIHNCVGLCVFDLYLVVLYDIYSIDNVRQLCYKSIDNKEYLSVSVLKLGQQLIQIS